MTEENTEENKVESFSPRVRSILWHALGVAALTIAAGLGLDKGLPLLASIRDVPDPMREVAPKNTIRAEPSELSRSFSQHGLSTDNADKLARASVDASSFWGTGYQLFKLEQPASEHSPSAVTAFALIRSRPLMGHERGESLICFQKDNQITAAYSSTEPLKGSQFSFDKHVRYFVFADRGVKAINSDHKGDCGKFLADRTRSKLPAPIGLN